ncbi:unnamed protein product, partial [Mesorhabditis belari]|uniref:Saposin B-type domain-containing protein n=1 Tax=Mesorhabditis belari TaxID=2138241 RepID=A0AAF3EQL8_9BILA
MRTLLLLLAVIVGITLAVHPIVENKLICEACEKLVEDAEKYGGDDLEGYLKKKISEVCDFTVVLKKECEEALDDVLKELITYIEKKASPSTCCKEVKLC